MQSILWRNPLPAIDYNDGMRKAQEKKTKSWSKYQMANLVKDFSTVELLLVYL